MGRKRKRVDQGKAYAQAMLNQHHSLSDTAAETKEGHEATRQSFKDAEQDHREAGGEFDAGKQ